MFSRPSLLDDRLRVVDLAGGEVDADELCVRRGDGHRDQVAAGGAAEFEHSRLGDRRRRRAEQRRDRGEPIRVRARMSAGAVRHVVVRGLNGRFRLNARDGIGWPPDGTVDQLGAGHWTGARMRITVATTATIVSNNASA